MFRRGAVFAFVLATAFACAKIPTKETSRTPQDDEPKPSYQPDPEANDGDAFGQPFDDAAPGAFEASCPDAMPEGGAECLEENRFARGCAYDDDGSAVACDCFVTVEGSWWACRH